MPNRRNEVSYYPEIQQFIEFADKGRLFVVHGISPHAHYNISSLIYQQKPSDEMSDESVFCYNALEIKISPKEFAKVNSENSSNFVIMACIRITTVLQYKKVFYWRRIHARACFENYT